MANAPNPGINDGDVRSIFSHELSEKLSVAHKAYTEPVVSGELVTVTVDGFGVIDYRIPKTECDPEGEEEHMFNEERGDGDFLEEQSVAESVATASKVVIQRYTFTNKNQMTVQVRIRIDWT